MGVEIREDLQHFYNTVQMIAQPSLLSFNKKVKQSDAGLSSICCKKTRTNPS